MNREVFVMLIAFILLPLAVAGQDQGKPERADESSRATAYGAILPGGVKIELVAIVTWQESQIKAWKPDGEPTEVSDQWPSTVGDDVTHAMIFHYQGLPAGHSLAWQVARNWITPVLNGSPAEFVSIRSSQPPRLADVSVAIAGQWGPWQPTQIDGTISAPITLADDTRYLYGMVDSMRVHGAARPVVVLHGFVDDPKAKEYGDYEIVGVSVDGDRHQRRGVGSWNGISVPYFDLERDPIAYFEYRLRPYLHWVHYRNISLREGLETDLRVRVATPTKPSN